MIQLSYGFLLKTIEHSKVLKKYLDGEFKTAKIEKFVLPTSNKPVVSLEKKYSLEYDVPIHQVEDKQGNRSLVVLTNVRVPSEKVCCNWCRLDDLPLRYGVPTLITQVGNAIICYVDDPYYCSMECMYANYNQRCDKTMHHYSNTEILINRLFFAILSFEEKMNSKNERLKEALDWRLLEINGGSLTPIQYRHEFKSLYRSINFVINSVNVKYTR